MSLSVYFLEPAEKEFLDAIDFYNNESIGLGFEFAKEIQKSINLIIEYPLIWSKFSKNSRKCKCKRFPYNIIYSVVNSSIIIVAIMHTSRKPNYWKSRI